jgi:hypothetical protein
MTRESVRDLMVDELDRVGGGGVPMGPPIYVTIPFPTSGFPITGGGGTGHHAPLQH